MIVIVIRKAPLRPVESPILPNTSAPSGRTMNPTANVNRMKMKA